MYNGQIDDKSQAGRLVFPGEKEESHSNPSSDAAGRAITRKLERGQVTITFADQDNPDIVDAVLGLLLQNLPE